MTWREIAVTGFQTRSAVDHDMAVQAAVFLELAGDELPPHSYEHEGRRFVELMITDVGPTSDVTGPDQPDEPMVAVTYTGTINGTDIKVQLCFVGETLDHCFVEAYYP